MPEPKFVPKPGQVNYGNVRYAPVINILVVCSGEILLVKRSSKMNLYPGHWATIDGFLDDKKSIEQKTQEELNEEVGIPPSSILNIKRGQPILREAPEYKKTWIIMPVLSEVKSKDFSLNWEADVAKWFKPSELSKILDLPHQKILIQQFFPEAYKS